MKELLIIQEKLKAPKNQYNSFWKYNYRNAEDILEWVKPILKEAECILLISDEVVNINDRFYVKATAKLINKEWKEISVTGFAREEESKKGMDWSQVTWASSSYARKYALNWLFAIDDWKDGDSTNTHWKETKKEVKAETKAKAKISYDSWCPDCWVMCKNIKKWTTKEWKAYEMWNCECWTKFFINRK